ncbi:hypothetical protein HY640_02520 [Candidatus Woesearchaeota archaeon]|nr:hypothetical protein [Candidatus Woesearchaeota archaeon]
MANTKAQISIFIVAGLIALFTAGLFLFITTRHAEKPQHTGEEQLIQQYIHNCLKSATDTSERRLDSGELGSDKARIEFIEFSGRRIPVYSDKGRDLTPTTTYSETKLAQEIKAEFEKCSKLNEFVNHGYRIESSQPEIKTTLGDDALLVQLQYTVKATKGSATYNYKEFTYTLKTPYKKANEIIRGLVESANANPGTTDMTYIANQNTPIMMISTDKKTRVYQVISPDKTYTFAVRD